MGIGLLYAARGLGALIGPFIARAIVGTETRGIVRGILGSVIVVAISYALFPLSPGIWIAALLVFCAHLGGGAQWMLSTYGLQRAAPDEIRGRVFSFDYGLVTLTIAASTILAGHPRRKPRSGRRGMDHGGADRDRRDSLVPVHPPDPARRPYRPSPRCRRRNVIRRSRTYKRSQSQSTFHTRMTIWQIELDPPKPPYPAARISPTRSTHNLYWKPARTPISEGRLPITALRPCGVRIALPENHDGSSRII